VTTIDCTVEWALGLVQLDSIQLMVPLHFSHLSCKTKVLARLFEQPVRETSRRRWREC
jgi:hypothetical protein